VLVVAVSLATIPLLVLLVVPLLVLPPAIIVATTSVATSPQHNFATMQAVAEAAPLLGKDVSLRLLLLPPVAHRGAEEMTSPTAETCLVFAETALGVSLGLKNHN